MTGSPYINHFVQPDSIIPNPSDPQSWNRYSYVQNNPIRFTDPTGHFAIEDPGSDPCTYIACQPSYEPPKRKPNKPDKLEEYLFDHNKDDIVTLPTPVIPSSIEIFSMPSETSKPNWGKIAAGVGIILVVDLLIVAPVVVGLVLTPGALEVTMLATETGWVLPLAGAIVAVNVYGWNLIIEGVEGR